MTKIYFDRISIAKQNVESESPKPKIKKAGDKSNKVKILVLASSGLSTRHSFVGKKALRP